MRKMREKLGFLVFVLALLCGSCLGRFVVVKNSLKVISSESVKGVYECAIENFGIPQYGGAVVGRVEYPGVNQKACFKYANLSSKPKCGGLPTFLLVDRGDCYFMLKAKNALNSGAAAILIADNKAEPFITMDIPEEEHPKNAKEVEFFQTIPFPSVYISKSLGDSIKMALFTGEMVNINLDWTEVLSHSDKRVEYKFGLWSSYKYIRALLPY